MIINRGTLIFFLVLSFGTFFPNTDSLAINLGPLYRPVKNSKYEREFTALGPFITYKRSKEHSEFGLRPFYYKKVMRKNKTKEIELLYPMTSYKATEDRSWFQYQFFLLTYETRTDASGYKNKEFNLIPFIFYNSEKNPDNDHFAFFPFYGNIKNKFAKDYIKFVLFPLYIRTESDGEITRSVIWPFISRYDGEHKGGKVFPIAGKRTNEKKGIHDRFLFWPVYVEREKVSHGERSYFKSVFPLYSKFHSYGISNTGYFWPFVQHTINHKKDSERWDIPWPFINVTRGKTTNQTSIFPFYSKTKKNKDDEDGYILFPLYRYKNITLSSYRRHKKSFFLFVYKDLKDEPIVDGVKPKRKIDLWPIFTYRKDPSGRENLHLFTIFEPFIHSNERLYRNYAPLWRIFTWERSADNITRSSFLWNLVSLYKDEKMFVLDIRPILPLFSYSSGIIGKSWNILGGFIGYSSEGGRKKLKLLYIPIKT